MEYWDRTFKWIYNENFNLYRRCFAADRWFKEQIHKFSKNSLTSRCTAKALQLWKMKQNMPYVPTNIPIKFNTTDVPSVGNQNAEMSWLLQLYIARSIMILESKAFLYVNGNPHICFP